MNWQIIINSNFVGSLLGTSIAGVVTYLAMKREIRFQKKSREIKEIEEFLKVCNIFSGYINEISIHINSIMEIAQSKQLQYDSIQRIQWFTKAIEKLLIDTKSLSDEKILLDIHKAYRLIITVIDAFNLCASQLLTVNNSEEKEDIIKNLIEYHSRLNIVIDNFDEFKSDQEQKLKI